MKFLFYKMGRAALLVVSSNICGCGAQSLADVVWTKEVIVESQPRDFRSCSIDAIDSIPGLLASADQTIPTLVSFLIDDALQRKVSGSIQRIDGGHIKVQIESAVKFTDKDDRAAATLLDKLTAQIKLKCSR